MKFPQQNINQSETGIVDKKLSVELYVMVENISKSNKWKRVAVVFSTLLASTLKAMWSSTGNSEKYLTKTVHSYWN